jgi:BirA family biotin operon repressor/biotin-[acetyl-CoA-carboxylase] ligase
MVPSVPQESAAGAGEDPEGLGVAARAIVRAARRDDLRVECVARTGSTQADLCQRARAAAAPFPVLRLALHQEAGRGRMGRAWHASDGGSLLFSLCLPWSLPTADTPAVTLACGCALATVLDGHGVRVALKWPNDLLLEDAKLAGILVELVQDGRGSASLVIGVGCNLALGADAKDRIDQEAIDLACRLGRPAALALRDPLAGEFAAALLGACARFVQEGLAPFRAEYDARLAFQGERVRMMGEGRRPLAGTLLGIDAGGRLLLETTQGTESVSGGELRRERTE